MMVRRFGGAPSALILIISRLVSRLDVLDVEDKNVLYGTAQYMCNHILVTFGLAFLATIGIIFWQPLE